MNLRLIMQLVALHGQRLAGADIADLIFTLLCQTALHAKTAFGASSLSSYGAASRRARSPGRIVELCIWDRKGMHGGGPAALRGLPMAPTGAGLLYRTVWNSPARKDRVWHVGGACYGASK